MKMCVRLATLAFALITSLSLASCSREENQSGRAASLSPEGQTAPTVEVTRVISEKLQATVLLPAELVPYEQVEVYSKVTGFVKWIKVDRGSRVKKGELIAELDAPELVAQLAAAKARLAADEGTYQRLNAAARTAGVVAPNDLDIAEKAVESDQGNVSALEKTAQAAQESLRAVGQLESYLDITAPFDGEITTRFVHPGALVGPAGGP